MIVFPDLEAAAVLLGNNPDYRVLRRFVPRGRYTDPTAGAERRMHQQDDLKRGLYVDVETTGLDVTRDQIIELAVLPFEFDHCGNVYGVGLGVSWFNDPGMPIPAEVTALTGITDEMVRGKTIDDGLLALIMSEAKLAIAHNADFDRKMAERRIPAFVSMPWACSYREVEWDRFGCVGGKLQHILEGACGEFYDAHRAIEDARVGVHVLAAAKHEGRTALSYLLESARTPSVRLWVVDTPYSFNMRLKQRRYRWSDGEDGRRRGWYRDCTVEVCHEESAWLASEHVRPIYERFNAFTRYSVRAGA